MTQHGDHTARPDWAGSANLGGILGKVAPSEADATI
jgi:hypothetical protein